MKIRSGFILTALVAMVGLAACAPRAAREAPAADAVALADDVIPIQVEHNAPIATPLTVYLVDSVGPRRMLGTVAPGQVLTFVVEEPIAPGPVTLIAEGAPGRGITSRPIHLEIRDGVRWVLNTNSITSLLVEERP